MNKSIKVAVVLFASMLLAQSKLEISKKLRNPVD